MTELMARCSLTIELTSFCNQRCGHCYNAFNHARVQALPTEQLLKLLGRLFSEVDLARVDLSGGEPFASEGLFPVLELCAERGVRANLVSNATLVSTDDARRLARYEPGAVQVTLNGPSAESHDAAVGMPGAWNRALRGIERLQQHGVLVVGCIVLTHATCRSVGETLERWRGLGISTVALMRLMSGGVSAHNLGLLPTRGEFLDALRQAVDPCFSDMTLRVGGPVPPCVMDHGEFPTLQFGWCPIGTPSQDFALGTDGLLRLCPFFEQGFGDVRVCSMADLTAAAAVRTYRRRAPEFCRDCIALPRCLGGCGAAALAVTGDPNALDPFVLQHTDPDLAWRIRTARADLSAHGPRQGRD